MTLARNLLSKIFHPTSSSTRTRPPTDEKPLLIPEPHAPLPEPRLNISDPSLCTPPPPNALLLRLPLELRLLIYTHVLGDATLHLVHLSRRIVHQRCPPNRPCRARYALLRECCPPITWVDQWAWDPPSGQFDACLALLLTCRQVYCEAVEVLYGANEFDLDDLNILLWLADGRLLPQRLQAIRRLRLRWRYYSEPASPQTRLHAPHDWETWVRFWEIVRGRMRLQGLSVHLEYWGTEEELRVDAKWLGPMLAVEGLRDVDVVVTRRANITDVLPATRLSAALTEIMKGKT